MYPVKTSLLTANRSHKILKLQGIVLHSTATDGATDDAEIRYFNSNPNRQASAHAFIDWDSITLAVPVNERAWHAGATANSKFLGIELCEPSNHNPAQFKEVWNRAIWYFSYLYINVIKINKVTKDNLMSHAEVSAKWHETDHQDPVAYFKEYGKTVEDFRNEVQKQIDIELGKK
jgi:N-acetylmuramoyl-L-alanine amidase